MYETDAPEKLQMKTRGEKKTETFFFFKNQQPFNSKTSRTLT